MNVLKRFLYTWLNFQFGATKVLNENKDWKLPRICAEYKTLGTHNATHSSTLESAPHLEVSRKKKPRYKVLCKKHRRVFTGKLKYVRYVVGSEYLAPLVRIVNASLQDFLVIHN